MDEQPEAPERALALEPGDEVVGQPDALQRRPEHELAGMEHERVVALDADELGQLLLLLLHVDVGVAVVVEHAEEAVDPHVDAGRLEQGLVVGIDLDPPLRQGPGDRRVGEDHVAIVTGAGGRGRPISWGSWPPSAPSS